MTKAIQLKTLELSNGETLGYRECGEGDTTLVLLHGNMNSSINWDLLMESLPESYKVYALDQRGFGISTYNKGVESMKDFSEDLKLFSDVVGIKGFVLVGWSAGGAVSMQFAVDYPDYVEKLILLESSSIKGYPLLKRNIVGKPKPGEFVTTKEEMAKAVKIIQGAYDKKQTWMLKKLLEQTLYSVNKPSEEKYEAYLEDMMKQRNLVDLNMALGQFNISHDHNGIAEGTGEVDKITMPTLVIQGAKDVVIPMTVAEENVEVIGENAELAVLDESGHSPLLDELDKLTEVIVQFVDEK